MAVASDREQHRFFIFFVRPLFLVFAALLAPALYAEQGRVAIALHDARDVIDGQLSGQDFVYFGREFDLSQAAGQRLLPFDELITRITRLAPEEALASALEKLTERIRTSSVVAPRALVLAALEQAHDLLVERHEQISSDDELRDLHSQLTLYKTAIEEDALTIAVSSEMREYGALAPTRTAGEGGSGSDASEYRLPEQGALDNGGLSVEVDGKPAVLADLIKVTRGSSFSISPGTNTATFNLASGNVSVDTSTPNAAITINQDLQTGAAVTFDSVDAQTGHSLTLGGSNATGVNVGTGTSVTTVTVGNATPTTALELPKGLITTGGVRYIHDTGGTSNFFAGVGAGNTTITGADNTAVGYQAGTSIGSANSNVLIGTNTGGSGSNTTFVGYYAGAANVVNSSTGVGYQALMHNTTGAYNTAVGYDALLTENLGNGSTAVGYQALASQNIGSSSNVYNTAVGYNAGANITSGTNNTCIGALAGDLMTSDTNNTCIGASAGAALYQSSGSNTLIGQAAGANMTVGTSNTCIGAGAGSSFTTEIDNITIGSPETATVSAAIEIGNYNSGDPVQRLCFIQGIYTATAAGGSAVYCSSSGQLGTNSSSRRYKENIVSLPSEERFMQLNPVSFNYKNDKEKWTEYGLIAEEVDEIYPEMVAHNRDGQVESVRYHLLDGIMIREIQENHLEIAKLKEVVAVLAARLSALEQAGR